MITYIVTTIVLIHNNYNELSLVQMSKFFRFVLSYETYYFSTSFFAIVLPRQKLTEHRDTELSVQSSFKLDLPPHLIIPSSSLKLNETIGQGKKYIYFSNFVSIGNRSHT